MVNKNKNGRVSIITRTKNRPILLQRALESISKQSFKDFIWVIVNDGGDPNPVEKIVKQAADLYINTICIHNPESLGMEAASNCGIRKVDSEFIVILDDDDSWESSFLKSTVDFLDKKNYYGGVVTLTTKVIEEIRDESIVIKEFQNFNENLVAVYMVDLARNNLFTNNSFLFRRSVIKEIGLYNENLPVLGDWEYNLRFLEKFDIGVIHKNLAFYHHRPDQKGYLGNTIFEGISKHLEYNALVSNSLIRKDLKKGELGIGLLVALGRQTSSSLNENVQNLNIKFNKLSKLAKKFGIKWVFNKFSK